MAIASTTGPEPRTTALFHRNNVKGGNTSQLQALLAHFVAGIFAAVAAD